jgi:hypothetical protein
LHAIQYDKNKFPNAYSPQGIKLFKQIGKKIQDATGEKLSTFYLLQSISMRWQYNQAMWFVLWVAKKIHLHGLKGPIQFSS